MVSTVGAIVSIFVFWGLADSQPMLYIFALLFGIFGGGFSTTWSGCAGALRRLDSSGNVDTAMVMSLLGAGRGIGAVITGPLSESLLRVDAWKGEAGYAYGSG